jgi:hypothetical protein
LLTFLMRFLMCTNSGVQALYTGTTKLISVACLKHIQLWKIYADRTRPGIAVSRYCKQSGVISFSPKVIIRTTERYGSCLI